MVLAPPRLPSDPAHAQLMCGQHALLNVLPPPAELLPVSRGWWRGPGTAQVPQPCPRPSLTGLEWRCIGVPWATAVGPAAPGGWSPDRPPQPPQLCFLPSDIYLPGGPDGLRPQAPSPQKGRLWKGVHRERLDQRRRGLPRMDERGRVTPCSPGASASPWCPLSRGPGQRL